MPRGRPRKTDPPPVSEHMALAKSRKGARSSSRLGNQPQNQTSQVISDLVQEKQSELRAKRLEALQDDNFFGVALADEGDGDDFNFGEDSSITAPIGLGAARPIKRVKKSDINPVMVSKSFKLIIEAGEAPEFLALSFPDSQLPRRRFCCVCGLSSPYHCPKCNLFFCSLQCDETHQEMKCLKFTR